MSQNQSDYHSLYSGPWSSPGFQNGSIFTMTLFLYEEPQDAINHNQFLDLKKKKA